MTYLDFDGFHVPATAQQLSRQRLLLTFQNGATIIAPEHMVHGAARATDPPTSHAAAQRQTGEQISKSHRLVLDLLRANPGGLTDFELATRTGKKQTSIGVRRGELVRMGLVRNSGLTRPSDTGSDAAVWVATTTIKEDQV